MYLVDQNTFQGNPFFSLIITGTKLDNPKHHKKNKGPYIEEVASHFLHTVEPVKCKEVDFEENSQHATSIIQALISTTQ